MRLDRLPPDADRTEPGPSGFLIQEHWQLLASKVPKVSCLHGEVACLVWCTAIFYGWRRQPRSGASTSWRCQLCWAHLRRDIQAMLARGGRSTEGGEALRVEARQMSHWWHRVRDGTLTHASFRTSMPPTRREVERLLEAGQHCGVPKTEGTCREIFKRRHALWTFVRHEGVEPTNNAAERAIHPGV